VKKKAEGVRKRSFCWTVEGSLRCVEASQQNGSEGLGREGLVFFGKRDKRKEKSEELCSRELSYVFDLPLRLIGS
jgi:hypothetical protein